MFDRGRRGRALFAIAGLCACGGGGETQPSESTVMPLRWSAGDRYAQVVVVDQFEDPLSLRDDRCGLLVQVGEATAAGELPRSDAEGPCVVTESTLELRTQPEFAPLCAGSVRISAGSALQNLEVCSEVIPDRIELDCAAIRDGGDLRVVSEAADTMGEDGLGAADVSVPRAEKPVLMAPEPQGDGSALWPAGELLLGWGGVGASSVEIVVQERSGEGPAIRCFVEDTGRFVVPERLLEGLRGQITSVEVARVVQRVTDVEGVELRVSSRVSDAAWLFPRMD